MMRTRSLQGLAIGLGAGALITFGAGLASASSSAPAVNTQRTTQAKLLPQEPEPNGPVLEVKVEAPVAPVAGLLGGLPLQGLPTHGLPVNGIPLG